MGQSLFEKIQAKLELFRLEQRYTRRRNRRSTFQSNAVYVDGEYVYQTPNSTGSSSGSSADVRGIDALHGEKFSTIRAQPVRAHTMDDLPENSSVSSVSDGPAAIPSADRKKLNRFSSMPGFGGSYNTNKELPSIKESRRTSFIR
ncbi:hypothetical protein LIA77_06228 [Sarocladium implicatum]|nr:hypothetical protein LIA77_06228 [Sarocladium implicatum]